MTQRRKRAAQGCLALALETSCRLLHPFMPFITEEVRGSRLPKPTGTPGSIMITMYPVADANLIDEAAEREMSLLQEVTVAIRNLRAAGTTCRRRRSWRSRSTAACRPRARRCAITGRWCRALARVGELHLSESGRAGASGRAVVEVLGELQVGVKLAGTIDVAAEGARLDKDLTKTARARRRARAPGQSFVRRSARPPRRGGKKIARGWASSTKRSSSSRSLERLKQLYRTERQEIRRSNSPSGSPDLLLI